jgi:Tol biopolymer transport system component
MQFWVLPWPDDEMADPHQPFSQRTFRPSTYFDWMPDSHRLLFSVEERLWLGDTNTGELKVINTPAIGEVEPSVSPEGQRVLHSRTIMDCNIVEVPLDGSPPHSFLATAQQEYSPSWSRDGQRMVFVTNKHGSEEVWLRSPEGNFELPVVTQKDFPEDRTLAIMYAVLSPDGTRIAFRRRGEKDGARLWLSPADGGRPVEAFPEADNVFSAPAWSPDGSMITFSARGAKGNWRLAIARPGSQEPLRILHESFYPNTVSAWAPNGNWIAVGGARQILIVSPDGRQSEVIPSPVTVFVHEAALVWSRDSSTLFVVSSYQGSARLDALDIATKKWRNIADWGTTIRFRVIWNNGLTATLSPQGNSFFTTAMDWRSDIYILEGFNQ